MIIDDLVLKFLSSFCIIFFLVEIYFYTYRIYCNKMRVRFREIFSTVWDGGLKQCIKKIQKKFEKQAKK